MKEPILKREIILKYINCYENLMSNKMSLNFNNKKILILIVLMMLIISILILIVYNHLLIK